MGDISHSELQDPMIVKESNPEKSTLQQTTKKLTSTFPQVVNGKLAYLLTGSLAIKLALCSDRIAEIDLKTFPEIVEQQKNATNKDFTPSSDLLTLPKDVDVVAGNNIIGTTSDVDPDYWKLCYDHTPHHVTTPGMIVEDISRGEYLNNPALKKVFEISLGNDRFYIINPAAIAALRNAFHKGDETYKNLTRAYIEALKQKLPSLYGNSPD